MPDERFADHLQFPRNHGLVPEGARQGAAGGAACGDLVRIALRVDEDRITATGFDAEGCGALTAAASAAVELVDGATITDAARVGTRAISDALGGLSPGKLHAADLVADALHRALGHAALHDARTSTDPDPDPDRVLVAVSGGVDSTVAALLEQQAGREVVCATLELWRDPENDGERSCCSADAVRGARAVAHQQGLPHLTIDLRDAFRAGVVDPWLEGHAAGRTPNPCIRCNGEIRLDALLDLAGRLGAGAGLATGHYARKTPDGRLLRLGADPFKDQAYALAGLAPTSIARLRFPLGERRKQDVRALAREHALPVADKPDSQDLCFLAGTGRARFLARHGALTDRPGPLVATDGTVLAEHPGHHHFTVGQRRGLGVSATEPLYVTRTDAATNTVMVGTAADLETTTIPLEDVRLHAPSTRVRSAKLRYKAAPIACALEDDVLVLDAPTARPAPGQAAVLLDGDVVIGVATIA